MYGLPSYAQAGFVAYNTEIQAAIPIGAKTEQIEEQLGAIVYGGYTNAGEGLSQAVKLFSGSRENKESYIVMLTDGEISGKHFAVFEMENPEPGSIDITYGITGKICQRPIGYSIMRLSRWCQQRIRAKKCRS